MSGWSRWSGLNGWTLWTEGGLTMETSMDLGWLWGGLAALVSAGALVAVFLLWCERTVRRAEARAGLRRQEMALSPGAWGNAEAGIGIPVERSRWAGERLCASQGPSEAPAERADHAEVAVAEPAGTEPAEPEPECDERETYCPACVVVALENHQGYARGDWRQGIFVPVGAVVTAGMRDGTARAQACEHHARLAHVLWDTGVLARADRAVLAWGLAHHVKRLVARARTTGGGAEKVW